MNRLFFFGFGFVAWLVATIVFRIAGHVFFLDDNAAVLTILWIGAALGLIVMSLALFRWQKLTSAQRYEAVVLMSLPGMVLDALVVELFPLVYPNMLVTSASSFGAWLLWAYASVLIAAMLPIGVNDQL